MQIIFNKNLSLQTAGILCSFYFGKWMCFYARHRQNVKRWHHMEQVLSDRTLQQTLRKFNQSQHQRSWVPSNDVHWYDADQMRGIRALLPLVPVSNDHLNPNGHDTSSPIISAATAATQTTRKVSLNKKCHNDFAYTSFHIRFTFFLFFHYLLVVYSSSVN